ncbi:hypothetical protein [Chitinophaga pinensis]|uniref:Uncharacterized protein n=1 Tax=Chitinophaga pinensis (strain ATCC 43595 / DSM 2588 / LMG 13176 / NBRC 15968 / NCIMB 11800 / UQM 2034) TaxID=485918 RepID=A0A979G9A8_CHIPD|nr:hypothetical protein [Chitinophaga pinensis]ACU63085.1 hypothetical protein Cpin_5661 [Chitinophaga pinensis DSM 2588]
MFNRLSYIIGLTLLTLVIFSCSSPNAPTDEKTKSPTSNNYDILSEEKYETSGKAQLLEYAVYKDSIYTKVALEKIVLEIYNLNRDKNIFKQHDAPTVIGVYLYTSQNAFKDRAEWIAMLTKGPYDSEPRISFNDFKITALNGQNDSSKTNDEIELEKLKSYLQERGLELCTFADTLKKVELDNIHKADAKYPDYGDKHMAMIKQLDTQFYESLKKKHKMNENIITKVAIFAMSYCK